MPKDCVVCGKILKKTCRCPWGRSFEETDHLDRHWSIVFMNTIRAMVFDSRKAEEVDH